MACLILTYFQVMSGYIDFMSVFTTKFGEQIDPSDLRFSGFKRRMTLSPSPSAPQGLRLPQLGRSGRGFQLCFNLKCVFLKKSTGPRVRWQWSPRQAAFHHQFDIDPGTTLWIMTAARNELEQRVQELVGESGQKSDRSLDSAERSFISSLAVHAMLAQWSSEDWRGYIRWLEQVLEEKVTLVPYSSLAPASTDQCDRLSTRYAQAYTFQIRMTCHTSRKRKTRPTRPS